MERNAKMKRIISKPNEMDYKNELYIQPNAVNNANTVFF